MSKDITGVIGNIPFRMAFAGGWIDQPFLSQRNPSPPGSMVVVSLEPTSRFMNRCGMATSTRDVAMRLWGATFPDRAPSDLVKELYTVENEGKAEPSGFAGYDRVALSGREQTRLRLRLRGRLFSGSY